MNKYTQNFKKSVAAREMKEAVFSPGVKYLYPSVTAEVEVKLVGVGDICVHGGAGWDVPTAPHLTEHTHTHTLLKLYFTLT